MHLELAEFEDIREEDVGKIVRRVWRAQAYGLTVTFQTDDLDLELYVDIICTMRQVGVALVDNTRTMRANTRRDRKGNE